MTKEHIENCEYKSFYEKYDRYCEKSVSPERITYRQVEDFLIRTEKHNLFSVEKLGESVEGRDINKIKFGQGSVKILAWTQMHGDEPTATAAVFDLINFFCSDDEFNNFRKNILSKIEIHIIPMLNPDGAEKHQRENILNIDLNRDAARQETPEAQILFQAAKNFKPDFGFNLHDQNSYYTPGKRNNTAAVSLLAPPFDDFKTINETRSKSMGVIAHIYDVLSKFIPNQIARYNDDFEPRAFGDNFTRMGISTILIESGYIKGDRNKSLIRKLNFVALLWALKIISEKQYEAIDVSKYSGIPENESLLFDLLLRNLSYEYKNKVFKVDIGINREKCFDDFSNSFFYKSSVEQIGDLSIYYGIEEHDLNGCTINEPFVGNDIYTLNELRSVDFKDLYSRGIIFLRINDNAGANTHTKFPINFLTHGKIFEPGIQLNDSANFIITNGNETKYVIVNGFIQNISENHNSILNGLVID
jgi:hypothetical protein